MKTKFIIQVYLIILAFYLNTNTINGQILQDSASLTHIKKAVDYIYNFQFAEAKEICNEISKSYPEHPVLSLLKGMTTYWENYPLIPAVEDRISYVNDLQNCIQLCEKKHNHSDETEYLLVNLCARGMLLMFYSDNDLSTDVFPLAISTYPGVRRSFDVTSVYPDFYFFTGLYNYYREAYPEAHPLYKPLAFLFPKGSVTKGLKEIHFASENSIFLKAESYSFLSWIYINFENDYRQATFYSKTLHELYPDNVQYLAVYIKNLLLIKEYDEAENLMGSTAKQIKNSFYQAQLTIFNGILQEKKYRNTELSQQFYEQGIRDINSFCSYGNEYAAYAYFGLSRIFDQKGDKTYKKVYQKKAVELAEFKKVDFGR